MELLNNFDILFTFSVEFIKNNEYNLNGIWSIKKVLINKHAEFRLDALLTLPLESSHKPLVIPQTGHWILNNLSNKQKWGNKSRNFKG